MKSQPVQGWTFKGTSCRIVCKKIKLWLCFIYQIEAINGYTKINKRDLISKSFFTLLKPPQKRWKNYPEHFPSKEKMLKIVSWNLFLRLESKWKVLWDKATFNFRLLTSIMNYCKNLMRFKKGLFPNMANRCRSREKLSLILRISIVPTDMMKCLLSINNFTTYIFWEINQSIFLAKNIHSLIFPACF